MRRSIMPIVTDSILAVKIISTLYTTGRITFRFATQALSGDCGNRSVLNHERPPSLSLRPVSREGVLIDRAAAIVYGL